MITLVDIRTLVDRLVKKEQRGDVISGDDFNTFLRISQSEHFDVEKRKAEVTNDIIDSLRGFIVSASGTTISNLGTFAIPANYSKLLSAQRIYGLDYYRCDVVSQMEKEEKQSNSLTVPTDKYPSVSISDGYFNFDPKTSAMIKFVYYKKPTDPFLDFYYDVNHEYVYLVEGASYTLGTGEVYRDGTTSGSIDSLTTELEWEEDGDRVAIAYRLLTKLGVALPNNIAIELGMSEVVKSDNKI